MDRKDKLNKFFNQTVLGKLKINPNTSRQFLEAVCAQPDPVVCLGKLVSDPQALENIQSAMSFDVSPQFLNNHGAALLTYLFGDPTLKQLSGGDILNKVVGRIIGAPLLWPSLVQLFRRGLLAEQAEIGFAQLLLHLITTSGDQAASYRDLAKEPGILERFSDSTVQDVKSISHKIRHILSTYDTDVPEDYEEGPGGRHDNDFADFRKITILPTPQEIACQKDPFLRRSAELEDPATVTTRLAHYIDNQFRLNRDDLIYDVREELSAARGEKQRKHRAFSTFVHLAGTFTGNVDRRLRWALVFRCTQDLHQFHSYKISDRDRRSFLQDHPAGSKILRRQSLACIIVNGQPVSLSTVYRDEELLARKPPHIILQLEGEATVVHTLIKLRLARKDLRAVCPDVLLVEEAGEILESHILAALGSTTKHLILIGDHKYVSCWTQINLKAKDRLNFRQLRPKVNNYLLTVEKGAGFDLNRSLFERLVLKDYPHHTLSSQHHEAQDIADRKDLSSTSSKQNSHEVDMVLKIVKYLAQQGYSTDKMVVLTPYLGQLHKLREVLKNEADPLLNDLDSHDLVKAGLLYASASDVTKARLRLATIDNYQGEESPLVIVSLTRSNSDNDIGFMMSPERLNVLLSRARDGLFIIGNANTFMRSRRGGELWTKFLALLRSQGCIYDGFPIKCERHPSRQRVLASPSDFEVHCPDGGCAEPCGTMLNCGHHVCPSKCHQLHDHSKMACGHLMYDKCPADRHTLQWKCSEGQPTSCRRCDKEKKNSETQARDDYDRQQKLDAERQKHDKELAGIERQIKAEQDAQRERLAAEKREWAQKQKKKYLEDMRTTKQ
ncbi:hypothetical protein CONPUDRAFT_124579 [Coniophora puteana RWD-64-598 SS2]|uniref:DNA2/NAM7 helicase-like C-terminal domain-containing protein n=1 Tax=Coniophora puteana (strain RWD-64-598) TaxID=741705 RepID=A0A5M3MQK4_CONPW|nr:uncharacterized protein CONPUDRAFT_124579 [Coniophora puteana RWD-64-598 SS2]EIW81453.1 hypothetical protein CONPUDRAFT_124579 [Coniophora puteana RWD-64-598 SS2]